MLLTVAGSFVYLQSILPFAVTELQQSLVVRLSKEGLFWETSSHTS